MLPLPDIVVLFTYAIHVFQLHSLITAPGVPTTAESPTDWQIAGNLSANQNNPLMEQGEEKAAG